MNRASIAVDQLGRTVLEYVEEMGRIVLLFFSVLRWMFHPPP